MALLTWLSDLRGDQIVLTFADLPALACFDALRSSLLLPGFTVDATRRAFLPG